MGTLETCRRTILKNMCLCIRRHQSYWRMVPFLWPLCNEENDAWIYLMKWSAKFWDNPWSSVVSHGVSLMKRVRRVREKSLMMHSLTWRVYQIEKLDVVAMWCPIWARIKTNWLRIKDTTSSSWSPHIVQFVHSLLGLPKREVMLILTYLSLFVASIYFLLVSMLLYCLLLQGSPSCQM